MTTRILFILLFAFSALGADVRQTVPHCRTDTALLAPVTDLRAEIRAGKQAVKKVSVVVPVYREWSNRNLFTFLENFAEQSAAKNQFEIVLVVNNTPKARTEGTDGGYAENQRVLDAVKYLNDPKTRSTFSISETIRLAKIRDQGISVRAIDQTAGVERNMGKIRDSGFREVYGRNFERPRDCLVATLDMDTVVPSDYVENAIVHFTLKPKLGAVYMPMELHIEPGSDRRMYRDTHSLRQRFAEFQFMEAVRHESIMGGPQLIANAEVLERVGGVPHHVAAENVALMRKLNDDGATLNAADMRVFTADRARHDGFFGGKRFEDLHVHGKSTFGVESRGERFIIHELARMALGKAKAVRGPHFSELAESKKLAAMGLRMNPVGPVDIVSVFRGGMKGAELARFDEVVAEAASRDASAVNTLREALKQRFAQHQRGEKPTIGDKLEFLAGNNWIDAQMRDWVAAGKTPGETLAKLTQEFPEWIGAGDEAPARGFVSRLDAIAQIMREAQASPDEYPGATAFSDLIRTRYK